MKKIALHWQILIGMALGVIVGFLAGGIGEADSAAQVLSKKSQQELVVLKQDRQRLEDQLKAIGGQILEADEADLALIAAKKSQTEEQLALVQEEINARKKNINPPSKGKQFIQDWIAPFGTIFINLLKMIAIPIILVSLIKGVSDLKDISKFSTIGGRTIAIYILTTVIAITLGLTLVNLVRPGEGISQETLDALLMQTDSEGAQTAIANAGKQQDAGPLQALVDIVPTNVFGAFSDNGSMLKVIFFSILFGICLLLIDPKKAEQISGIFDGLYDIILKMVDLIMLTAPYAVFALLANVVVNAPNAEILNALGIYMITVIIGLALMVVVYSLAVWFFGGKNPFWFLNKISPAQLLAFSTSSSAATLPVTMERVTEHVGVDEEVSSFVLPVGATINMDGTSLYQAVAAVFISFALGHNLELSDQLVIVLTALLASIGSAAVPGAGLIMLVIVLQSIDFPADKLPIGIALVLAVDRPLDMLRTVINVTGDATVSTLVAKSVGKLGKPEPQNIGDYYSE
ncbi:MAG: cation:dicarboxylase symporter family transporter [Bacteroidota bacterium]